MATEARTLSLPRSFRRLYSTESTADDGGQNIVAAAGCCIFIFCNGLGALIRYGVIAGFTLLLMVIAFAASAKSPRFYISDFRVSPVTGLTDASAAAASITCQFDIHNRATLVDAHYDEFLISVSNAAASGVTVTSDILSFHQEPCGVDRRKVNIQLPADFVLRLAAPANRSAAREAAFHVGLQTTFRYMSLIWKSGRHGVIVGADVQVDANGRMLSHERIELQSSGAPRRIAGSAAIAAITAITMLLFLI